MLFFKKLSETASIWDSYLSSDLSHNKFIYNKNINKIKIRLFHAFSRYDRARIDKIMVHMRDLKGTNRDIQNCGMGWGGGGG
jgi:hypothetical protein